MKFVFQTDEKRSALMKKIKSKNTGPELLLRKELWHRGIRYRINASTYKGKPDLVFKSKKLVVFIDGEFWHGYNWEDKKKKISANRDYWIPKIERNIQRDELTNEYYRAEGYTVLRFWTKEVICNLDFCAEKIIGLLKPSQRNE